MRVGDRTRLAGYGSMALAAVTWGSIPVITPRTAASPFVLVAMRMGFGAAVLGIGLAVAGLSAAVPRAERRLVGAMGIMLAASWVMFFAAIERIGATAVLIGYVFPVLVALLARRFIGEHRERGVLLLACVGLAGVATIFAPRLREGEVIGVLLALGLASTSAVLVMCSRRVVALVPGPVVAFWENVVGSVLLLPLALASTGPRPWAWGALLGVVHTAAAGVLFFRAVGRAPAAQAAIIMYLEPVSAVLFVWLVNATAPTLADIVGGLLVVGAGVGIATRRAAPGVADVPPGPS